MKRIAALLLGSVMVASPLYAATIDAGTIEIDGGTTGLFSSTTYNEADATVSTFNADINALYYVAPNLGIGASVDFTKHGSDADDSALLGGAQVLYNFSLNESVNLLVGGEGGFISLTEGSEDATGWYAGAGAGIRYFMNEYVAVDCGFEYVHGGGDVDLDTFGASLGIAFFLL